MVQHVDKHMDLPGETRPIQQNAHFLGVSDFSEAKLRVLRAAAQRFEFVDIASDKNFGQNPDEQSIDRLFSPKWNVHARHRSTDYMKDERSGKSFEERDETSSDKRFHDAVYRKAFGCPREDEHKRQGIFFVQVSMRRGCVKTVTSFFGRSVNDLVVV